MPVRMPNSFDKKNINFNTAREYLYILDRLKRIESKVNVLLGRKELSSFSDEPYSEDFIKFWNHTNKKGNKKDAFLAFRILVERNKQTLEDIVIAYDQMAEEKKENHIQFWPGIDRFLSHYYDGYLSRAKDSKRKWGDKAYLRTGLVKKDKC